METKQSRDSRFATVPGLAALLFFAVLAIYFKASLAAAFLAFFFLLCLGSRCWSVGVLKRVEFEASARQSCCYAGEPLALDLKVRNKSFFPLVWLDVILPAGKKPLVRMEGETEDSWYVVSGDYEAQTGIRERFVWLLWQQEIRWEETLTTLRRGWVEIKGADLQAGDGFGLCARQRWHGFAVPLRLIVYPKIVPVNVRPFLKITQEAVAKNSGQTEDITILKNSHPYQPVDPMKRINWRILAGSGRMETKIYETVMPGCSAFLLDLESFTESVEDFSGVNTIRKTVLRAKELEQMISLAASCVQAIAEQGMSSALVIPAYGDREEVILVPGREETALSLCMEALAMVDYEGQETRFPYEEFWRVSHRIGTCYLCSRTDGRTGLEELADMLGRSRMRRMVLQRGQDGVGEYDCLYAEDLALEPPG